MSIPVVAAHRRCCLAPKLPFTILTMHSRRRFSSASFLLAAGPESPRYIEVPEPLQAPKPPKSWVKGVLPLPRNILPRQHEYKASKEWLEEATPEPKSRPILPEGPDGERLVWRQRMASMRRKNLREGMTELMARQQEAKRRSVARTRLRVAKRKALQAAPDRIDELLTNPSLTDNVRAALAMSGARRRQESQQELELRRQRDLEQKRKLVEQKLDQVHTLYLNAKTFIVTEEQLEREIEEVFGPDSAPVEWSNGQKSIWALGEPDSIKKIAGLDSNELAESMSTYTRKQALLKERLMRIAEELTGGQVSAEKSEEDELMRP